MSMFDKTGNFYQASSDKANSVTTIVKICKSIYILVILTERGTPASTREVVPEEYISDEFASDVTDESTIVAANESYQEKHNNVDLVPSISSRIGPQMKGFANWHRTRHQFSAQPLDRQKK